MGGCVGKRTALVSRSPDGSKEKNMADRVLRGSRLGAVSYETDRNHDLAPRQLARYRTENGEEFEVPFADDAEIPGSWLCRNGLEGTLIEGNIPEPKKVKPPRTHCGPLQGRTAPSRPPLYWMRWICLMEKKLILTNQHTPGSSLML
jgi:hypothetical protein